jgi:hypothetical protein
MQGGREETGGTGGKPTQLEAVWQVMSDRDWHTLAEIAERASCPQASASARLRDLRKSQFGGRSIERHYVERGQFRYRVVDAPSGVDGDQV